MLFGKVAFLVGHQGTDDGLGPCSLPKLVVKVWHLANERCEDTTVFERTLGTDQADAVL